jgi:hypothetical protein
MTTSGTATADSATDGIAALVARFEAQRDAYLSQAYNETQLRREFLDPFFGLLGWDMDNSRGLAEAQKEVIHEDALKISGSSRAPDYSFRVAGERKFFVEAKKPSVNVREQLPAAYQLRRYAWSANLAISVLSDFEEFAIYDGRVAPDPTDGADTARLLYLTCDEYADRWEELEALLSRDAVLGGSIEQFVSINKAPRGTTPVDAAFLAEIESWRASLAETIARANPKITARELNYAVQVTIDRIVFLRICEDRGIEEYGQLERVSAGSDVYVGLIRLFEEADARYNSGLFHFREDRERIGPPDLFTLTLEVPDDVLKQIVAAMYYPRPYEFSVIPAAILGQVYEQFLGHVISLDASHEASVEEKPEVKKAGGVYYTPAYIVDFIVARTVGGLVEGRRPRDVANLRIIDPACGSGSFLLGAYQFLLDWHRDYYVAAGPAKHAKVLYQGSGGQWRLTTAERKRILLNNIFGVDIDAQAVEVTKLSLLLKVLEDETAETLNKQLTLLRERALPDLDANIRSGNALVDDSFYSFSPESLFDEDARYTVNIFSWEKEFPAIMTNGGFDAVIGNPPWLMAGYYVDETLEYLRQKYTTATGKFDLYYLFLEKSLSLAKPTGRIGMIVPNKLFHTRAAKALRRTLTDTNALREIVDFGLSKIFAGATNYSAILFLEPEGDGEPIYRQARVGLQIEREFRVAAQTLGEKVWVFHDEEARKVFANVTAGGVPLRSLVDRFGTGVQSGADRLLLVDPAVAVLKKLEPDALRPVLRGRDVRRYRAQEPSKLLIFPYEETTSGFRILSEPKLEERFPNVYAWLVENRTKLAKRVWFDKGAEELSGKWYGMMYLDAARTFSAPHLLTPSLSNVANFALGEGALFATGTAGVTSVIFADDVPESLNYFLALLNSRLLSYYAVEHSPIYQGGYRKFSAPYLQDLPIRRIDFSNERDVERHDTMTELSRRCLDLTNEHSSVRLAADQKAIFSQLRGVQTQIDDIVAGLYGLTEHEKQIVIDRSVG